MVLTFTFFSFLRRGLVGLVILLPLLGWGQSTTVVISQVYPGGGNAGATYANGFVELHNVSASSQSLEGLSVQYASATGTSWTAVALKGSIPAGGYYLVAGGGGNIPAKALAPNASGLPDMVAAAGKVALLNGTTNLVGVCPTVNLIDLVGYGTSSTCAEGAAAAAAGSATKATTRKNNGCTDTNNNANDFAPAAVNPRNAVSPAANCTTLVFYAKPDGALNLLTTFGMNTDGSGAAPASFSTINNNYVIAGTNRSLTEDWVIAKGSKVVLAAGTSLLIPPGHTLTGMLDQMAASTLIIQNSSAEAYLNIEQGVQDASSTVDFAQAGDYSLPILRSANETAFDNNFRVQNLKLTNGTKTFARNATTSTNAISTAIPGNLTLDATVVAGATSSPFSSIALRGNLTLLNGASFATVSDSKLTLLLLSATPQTLMGNGSDIILSELDAVAAGGGAILSTVGGSTNLELGNMSVSGGGYYLETGSSLVLNNNDLRFTKDGNGFIYTGKSGGGKGTVTPSATSSINLETKSNLIGSLLLAPGFTTVRDFRLLCANGELTVPSDLTVNGLLSLSDGRLALAPGRTLTLNGAVSATGGTIKGSATTNLVIGGTGALGNLAFTTDFQQLNNLTMNRAGSGSATLSSPLTVGGTLTLTAGLLATDATNVLMLPTTATLAGGSNTSFVSGPLVRPIGPVSAATTYVFPVGQGAAYRPISLNITSQSSSTLYRAEQLEGDPGQAVLSPDPSGTDLRRVSSARYFTLTPFGTAVPAVVTQPSGFVGTVTLSFGSRDGVTDVSAAAGLVVAKRSDSAVPWANFGTTALTGTPANGTITSGPITSFSSFALGSTNTAVAINPLPVQLARFTATRTPRGVQVAWATASELRNAYFEVERSLDGQVFGLVARVAAQGIATQAHAYNHHDGSAPAARLYYRLRQVDTDGTVTYSPGAAVAAGPETSAEVALSPNPARESISFFAVGATAYVVRTVLGQAVQSGTTAAGSTTLAVAGLPAGVYFLELRTDAGRVVRRFTKE